jgi:hypothetical protein
MANANITATTRELWLRTVKSQVFCRLAVSAALIDRKQVTMKGTNIKQTLDVAETDDLAQEYELDTEPLTSSKKTVFNTAHFHWKKFQVPVEYGVDEELENISSAGETQIVDLEKAMVKKAQRAARIKLYKMIWGYKSATSDTDKGFQGIMDALSLDRTYGGIDSTTETYWDGGHIGTDNPTSTAYPASIATFRQARSAIQQYVESLGDLMAVTSSAIFQSLQSEVETRDIYTRDGSKMAKYGFNSMMIDGVEIVEDPWLNLNTWGTATGYKTSEFFALLHLPDWELRIHPRRAMKFTGFTWQGEVVNGYDKWLARILTAGNFICWQPNASILLAHVA